MKIKILAVGLLLAALCCLTACEEGLKIQQAYSFWVETLPVPNKIAQGQTAEIRCTLLREGRFEGTRYTIRYFQPEGKGTLCLEDGTELLPNDRYPLGADEFRLYYTSASTQRQDIDIYFEDNFGGLFTLSFSFNNDDVQQNGPTER